jgi:arylsulfatase A-like enzyme
MPITRREFIRALSAGGAALTLPSFLQALAKTSKGAERPNIVWLDSEDNCPDISPYGESLAHTPNLDRFAREGATYTHAYAPCPVCSPARSAYITGMYPTSIGAQNHRSHRRDGYTLKPPVRPITDYFMEDGYFCTRGSLGHPNEPGKTDYNFSSDFDKIYNGTNWRNHPAGKPFFAQIHFEETHRPFVPDDAKKRPMSATESIRSE